jgi:RNA polymerase sigma-70 factor (sigma-E family)
VRKRDEAQYVEFAAGAVRNLRRTAYLMCGDWQRAEDAAQDALIRVYVAWPRLRRRHDLRAYATKAVMSVVMDQTKRAWRRERVIERLPDEPDRRPDQVGVVDDRIVVIEALAALPPRQRACLVLRYFEDLSVEETAEAMGTRTGTVKSQSARGLDAMRRSLRGIGSRAELGNSDD